MHTASCEKVGGIDPERRVDVSWDVKGDFRRPVSLRVITIDRPGLLAKISQTFSEAGINISQATVRTADDRALHDFEVTVEDLKQLKELMRSLERIDGVHSVQRVQEGRAS